jgi:hypothetical protein
MPIRMAASYGHVHVVKHLLQYPEVNAGAVNDAALRMASKKGHAAVVKVLLADTRGQCVGLSFSIHPFDPSRNQSSKQISVLMTTQTESKLGARIQ